MYHLQNKYVVLILQYLNSAYSNLYSQPVHEIATYRCDDTRGCVMQFWPPDDEHMCSKHAEAWNKLIIKQKFCASRWLITEIKKVIYTLPPHKDDNKIKYWNWI